MQNIKPILKLTNKKYNAQVQSKYFGANSTMEYVRTS